MTPEIRRYIAGCIGVGGQRSRATHTDWETVAVDILGPYPLTTRGNRFILVVTDIFTTWAERFALRNSVAPTLIRTLEDEVLFPFRLPTSNTERQCESVHESQLGGSQPSMEQLAVDNTRIPPSRQPYRTPKPVG